MIDSVMIQGKKIFIWNEAQRIPATVYGKANHWRGFTIEVHETASGMRAARAREPAAIVYHSGGGFSYGGGFQ